FGEAGISAEGYAGSCEEAESAAQAAVERVRAPGDHVKQGLALPGRQPASREVQGPPPGEAHVGDRQPGPRVPVYALPVRLRPDLVLVGPPDPEEDREAGLGREVGGRP